MKRYYRNRIMLSAMLSFLIILIVAVAGIWLFSYQQIEQNTDSFIASRLEPREEKEGKEERTPRFRQEATPAMFGYTPGRRNVPSGFYEITFTADGKQRQYVLPGCVTGGFVILTDPEETERVLEAFGAYRKTGLPTTNGHWNRAVE